MDMCYDGTLVMPSSYAVMSDEDMTYVEGGGWFSNLFSPFGGKGYIKTWWLSATIDAVLTFTGVNISAIGILASSVITKMVKKYAGKVASCIVNIIGSCCSSAITTCLGNISGVVGTAIMSATSLGGLITFVLDAWDGKINGKFTYA